MDRAGSPTITLLGLLGIVFLLQIVVGLFGGAPFAFGLAWPLTRHPWTLVTSVFAHSGPFHLAANALGLALVGIILERRTASWRFYTFFIGVGILAGVTEVTLGRLMGQSVTVLGASGAVFGLFGYLLAGNPLSETVAGRVSLSPRATVILLVIVAGMITWLTRGRGVALAAHFTGLLVGLVAGRAHLLR